MSAPVCEEMAGRDYQSTPPSAPTGPWFVCDNHPSHCVFHISENEDGSNIFHREVATIYRYGDIDNPRFLANARLIAAAPDLVKAARMALNFITNTEREYGITLDSGESLRAAIAKAEGSK